VASYRWVYILLQEGRVMSQRDRQNSHEETDSGTARERLTKNIALIQAIIEAHADKLVIPE
jgi:hypothetical protein